MSAGPKVVVLEGDVRERLRELPEASVHCVVTSPPYWGLRDYGVEGQLGLEPTIELYVEHMVDVFREVRRVLRPDGTLWLNMGDCYAAQIGQRKTTDKVGPKQETNAGSNTTGSRSVPGLKPKNLVGQPWRLAFALQADGWYLRSDIVWHKPNPMPESCRDRPTKAHEFVFLLTKRPRYFFDQEAVREPGVCNYPDAATKRGKSWHKHDADGTRGAAQSTIKRDGVDRGHVTPAAGRNIRTVWKIATQPFPEAHFATFPEKLVEPCVKAGTSEKGCCPACGAPWVRVVEKRRTFESGSGKSGNAPAGKHGPNLQGGGETGDVRRGPVVHATTTGWKPSCTCDAGDPVPCVVLDPFAGSGTTGLVALKLGRSAILVELKAEYAAMARKRCNRDVQTGLFQT